MRNGFCPNVQPPRTCALWRALLAYFPRNASAAFCMGSVETPVDLIGKRPCSAPLEDRMPTYGSVTLGCPPGGPPPRCGCEKRTALVPATMVPTKISVRTTMDLVFIVDFVELVVSGLAFIELVSYNKASVCRVCQQKIGGVDHRNEIKKSKVSCTAKLQKSNRASKSLQRRIADAACQFPMRIAKHPKRAVTRRILAQSPAECSSR